MRTAFISLLTIVLLSGEHSVSVARAKVRIYGGPVQSAGSGIYYAPFGSVFPAYTYDSSGKRQNSSENSNRPPLDLNPGFIPGTTFTPPGYLPRSFPRSLYMPYDYIGYYSRSSED